MSLTPLPHRARYCLHWSDDGRCIFTLGQGLGVLNLTRPSFALCSREYRPLWNIHVPSDLAQTNSAGVCSFDLLPNACGNSASHRSLWQLSVFPLAHVQTNIYAIIRD